MRILMTFFSELTTQSNTAFNFGTRFMVFKGRNTRRTRRDFIIDRFCTAGLPLLIPSIIVIKYLNKAKNTNEFYLRYFETKRQPRAYNNNRIHDIPKFSKIRSRMKYYS